jgi:hypothetical protein
VHKYLPTTFVFVLNLIRLFRTLDHSLNTFLNAFILLNSFFTPLCKTFALSILQINEENHAGVFVQAKCLGRYFHPDQPLLFTLSISPCYLELGEYVIYYSFSQKLAGPPPELALIVFHTHGPYSGMV